ncbi:MAG: tetratricopeptide repeat protein [Blastocatellia bacterium]
MKYLHWISLLAASLGLSAMAQTWIDARRDAPATLDDSLYLRSGATLKKASIGFDGLLADLYWIRTVQYFGAELETQRSVAGSFDPRGMRQLEPLLNIVTELDPHHIAAYRFGAFFLQYLEPEKAIRFAEAGIRNNPGEWRLYQDLGFAYWQQRRFREAAEAYSRGSRVAGAPAWMAAMAASMLERGGDRETARELFRRLCEGSNDPFIKEVCAQ